MPSQFDLEDRLNYQGFKILVFGFKNNTECINSKPCLMCANRIHQAGIEVVYYTDGKTIQKIKISEETFKPSSGTVNQAR